MADRDKLSVDSLPGFLQGIASRFNQRLVDGLDEVDSTPPPPRIPGPVFLRLMMLFSGGIAVFLVGIFASIAMNDPLSFIMGAVICSGFLFIGFLLNRKIKAGKIYTITGVCTASEYKLFKRYLETTFVDIESEVGDEHYTLLPRKTRFKLGHKYTLYFDRPQRAHGAELHSTDEHFGEDLFPTVGYLGYDHHGIYTEKKKTNAFEQVESNAEMEASSASNLISTKTE